MPTRRPARRSAAPSRRRNPSEASDDVRGSRLAFALNSLLDGKARFDDVGNGTLVNTSLVPYDAVRGGRGELNITIRSGNAVVSVRRTKAGGFANDYEIGTFKWDDVDGILALLREEFPALRRTNPRRRSAAPSRRRNPSWSKPIAYREDIYEVLDEVFPEGAVLEARGYVSDAENLRAGKAHVRKVVLDRFKEQGRQVDEMDLGRVLSSELDHYAGQDGRGSFVEVFRKQTAASRGDFAALVGRNNPRRRAASRRNPAKIGAKALATALIRAVDASLDSGDLARMDAVHHIMEKEGMRSLDGLYRQIRHDPVDFILVAAPGFSTALKRATGKSRDEWARLIG